MTPEELKKMMGLKPKQTAKEVVEHWDKGLGESVTATKVFGSTCFHLDYWELEQGDRLMSQSGPHRTPYMNGIHEEGGKGADIMSDFFAAGFRQFPEVDQQHYDQRFAEFVDNLLESPDFKALHESTRGNLLASDTAAVEFANQWSKLVEQDKVQQEQCSKQRRSKDPQAQKDAAGMACLAAVNNAIKAATEEVEQIEDISKAIGLDGNTDGKMPLDRMQKLFNQVKNNHQLRRICELAGRYRMAAQAKQRTKVSHGYDDMIGVELSGDVSRLLPLELAMLADEDFQDDAMRRLVEKQSMSRQYKGIEKQAKGPIIICVDESGSMNGEPLAQAKAFALAMYWIAKHQNRECIFVSFSSGVEGFFWSSKEYEHNLSLMRWLEHNYNGGTTMDVPLVVVPCHFREFSRSVRGKIDMIVITDAQVDVPETQKTIFLEFKKKEQVKLTTIVIGADAGDMKAVSDETFHVSGIDVNCDAVSKCLSI